MTWGMHAIGHLELGQEDEASKLFNRSYLPYVQVSLICVLLFCFFAISTQPPFYMWTEVPGGGGAVNFITGMRVPTGKIPVWSKLFRTATTRLFFMDILG